MTCNLGGMIIVSFLEIVNKKKLYYIVLLLAFLKLYITTKIIFAISNETNYSDITLIIGSLSSIFLFYGVSFYLINKFKRVTILKVSLLSSIILFANVVYFRFFTDFITFPVLFQFKNFGDLGGSAKGLLEPLDLFIFLDVFIIFILKKYLRWKEKQEGIKFRPLIISGIFLLTLSSMFVINKVGTIKGTNLENRLTVVEALGIYNYHAFDLFLHSIRSSQKAFAEESDLSEIKNEIKTKPQKNLYTGVAKGKNIILISLESFQSFLIDYKLNGKEVTPFLNDLVKESLYFENFYHQTGQGKTSDAEFIVDNSLYSLPRGSVFTTHSENEYNALPEILSQHGYSTAVFHGNRASFWNRDEMYEALGYQQFFSERFYKVNDNNSVNYGLNDRTFFQQSMAYVNQLSTPFYAKFLTLTNHFPYVLNENDKIFPKHNTGDKIVDRYFQTAHYLDDSLKYFFHELKKDGLYKDSIFILYGDHYGLSERHNKAMEIVLGKKITPAEQMKLQRVPLIIHIPGMEGKVIESVSGQIDTKPTILNLLGINNKDDIQFGTDLLGPSRDQFVILRDGSFISSQYIFTNETCYSKDNHKSVPKQNCEVQSVIANETLMLSDKIIYGDLLRFKKTTKSNLQKQ